MTVQTHIDATSGTGQPPERGTSRRWRWLLVAVGLCTAVVALLSASTSEAPERVKGTGSPDFAAIDRYVRSEMSAQRIPGLALGIVHGGQTVHLQGFGEAGFFRTEGDPADAVPRRFGDKVVHRHGHHAAE